MRSLVVPLLFSLLVGCSSNTSDRPPATNQAEAKPTESPTVTAAERKAPVNPLLKQADEAARQRDVARALELLDEAIRQNPKDAEAYARRATLRHQLGLHTAALSDFSAAIKHRPDDPRLYNNRGFVHLAVQQFEAALADFDEAVRLDPEYPNAYNNRGLVYLTQGRHAEAIRDFDRALQLDPAYVDAFNNRGFALLHAGRPDAALVDLNQAIRLNPKYVNAYLNRGLVHLRKAEYDAAVVDFTQAMILEPHNPKHYRHRREAYLKLGDAEKAREDELRIAWLEKLHQLSREVESSPNDALALVERGLHYLEGHEDTLAAADFEKAIQLQPKCARAWSARAALRVEQGQYDAAIADCTHALELEPHHEAWSVRGDAWLKKGEPDRALQDYEQAKRIDAAVAQAYLLRAESLQAQGKVEQAAYERERALALDPSLEARVE